MPVKVEIDKRGDIQDIYSLSFFTNTSEKERK